MEKKSAERELKRSEEKYRELVNKSPVGIFQTDSVGRVIHVNATMAHMLGAGDETEAVHTYTDLSTQLYVRKRRRDQFLSRIKKSGYVEAFEYEAKRLDGEHRWFIMSARMSSTNEDGSFVIDGFAIDVTELKQAEKPQKLRNSRAGRDFNHAQAGV
jgi:PAS domain S-box-containing protein